MNDDFPDWEIWDDNDVIKDRLTEKEARQYLANDTTNTWYAENGYTGETIETSDSPVVPPKGW